MSSKRTTFVTTSAVVIALGLATGAAQAMNADLDGTTTATATTSTAIASDRVGPHGVRPVGVSAPSPDWFERAAQRAIDDTPPPDWFERAAQRAIDDTAAVHLRRSTTVIGDGVTRPDDREARGPGARSGLTVTSATSTADDTLDWQAIGFGGAFVLALCAIGLGAALLGGHRRTPAH